MEDTFNFSEFLRNLTHEQLLELGSRINKARNSSSMPIKPINKITLNITVDDSKKLDPADLYNALLEINGGKPLAITVQEMAALQAIQTEIVMWINLSKNNAALFAVSPAKALRKSGITVSESLLTKLESLEKNTTGYSFFASEEIEKVTLKAKSIQEKNK